MTPLDNGAYDKQVTTAFYYLTLARNSESADWETAGLALAYAMLARLKGDDAE